MAIEVKLCLTAYLLLVGCNMDGEIVPTSNEDATSDIQGQLTFSKDRATLNIAGLPERPVSTEDSFSFTLFHENLPLDSGLYVFLERNTSEHSRYASSGGTLTIAPLAISGSGSMIMDFAGTVASAPADNPRFSSLDAGEYLIKAIVYSSRENRLGMMEPPSGRKLAEYQSGPIVFTGEPETSHFQYALVRAFETRLEEGLSLYKPGVQFDRYYSTGEIEFDEKSINQTFVMRAPFSGLFRLSAPASLNTKEGLKSPLADQIKMSGEIGFEDGIISYLHAREMAVGLLAQLPNIGTNSLAKIKTYATHWIYLPTEQVWLFEVSRSNQLDHAIIEVEKNGAARIIEYKPSAEKLDKSRFY